jgi:hypothetical protein
MGKAKASRSARELFAKSRGVNLLAAARVFLFGARDVWFVVGLPVFLYANGWTFLAVGAFLALWTIGYGVVQGAAPALVRRSATVCQPRCPPPGLGQWPWPWRRARWHSSSLPSRRGPTWSSLWASACSACSLR